MSGSRNFGEPPPKRARSKINIYSEHPDNKMNKFRAAEFRLDKNLSVTRGFVKNNRSQIYIDIPNPVKRPKQAFHQNRPFLRNVYQKRIFNVLPMQSQAWPVIMSGEDFIGIAGTEEDQKLAFLLPALLHIEQQRELRSDKELTVVCLSASRESALQINTKINKFSYKDIKCVCIGDDNDLIQYKALESLEKKEFEVIAATPVQLHEIIRTDSVILSSVSYLVLEKLDKILTSNFENQVKDILSTLQKESTDSQIIITSTSLCPGLEEFASLYLIDPVVVVIGSLNLSEINGVTQQFKYEKTENTKIAAVIRYLRSVAPEDKVVVFCDSDFIVYDLMEEFKVEKMSCRMLLDTEIEAREEILKGLKEDAIQILVTNVTACNLNMTDFRHICIYDFPKTIDEYVALIKRKSGDDRKITSFAILSRNDWAIVPGLIAVLRKTKQEIPSILFDLANRFEPITFLENPTFPELVKANYFVDKSMIIERIIENRNHFHFMAPSKFGKTTILNMLEEFFNVHAAGESLKIFKKLKIGRRQDIIEKRLGRYPILRIDMSDFQQYPVDSENACCEALRRIIHKTYTRYESLFEDFPDDHIFKRWLSTSYSEIPEDYVFTAFNDLAIFLQQRYNQKVIFLCDEFDSICENALSLNVSADILERIICKYFAAFTTIIKPDKVIAPDTSGDIRPPPVYRAVFTGKIAVKCWNASPLDTLDPDRFLESRGFSQFYGILKSEFEELLEKPEFEKLRDEKESALAFYNGYKTCDGRDILCTYSVAKYLSNVSLEKSTDRLKCYWEQSGSVERYTNVYGRDNMQERLREIVHRSTFVVTKFEKFSAMQLAKINEISVTPEWSPEAMDILFVYLQRLGYFSIERNSGHFMVLKIPNEEIRKIFSDVLVTSLLTACSSTIEQVSKYQYLNNFIDVHSTEACLKNLEELLSAICKTCPPINAGPDVDEFTLQHIVYAALLHSKYLPLTQEAVEDLNETEKIKRKKFDLCFYSGNFGVMVELKRGPTESAKSALEQIRTRKYYKLLQNGQLDVTFTRKLFIGVHVTDDGEVTLISTDDLENYKS